MVVGRTSGRRGRRARALARRAFRAISSTAAGHWAAMRHLLTTETNRNRGGANRGGVRKAPPGAPADVRRARAGARIDASTRRRCGCCARIAIFDERLREAQSGAVGEIVISGPCLARGYPDDPKQAAEKCLAHPSHAGERAYRMGNLARRLPDGAIQFVGRLDDQVKIRGYLVEPGEVEIAIARQQGVRRRAVVATSPADAARARAAAYHVSRRLRDVSRADRSADYQWWGRLVKTCIALRAVPELRELREGLSTVDYMTAAIAHIARNPAAPGKKFNLTHSGERNLSLEDFFDRLERAFGFSFARVPFRDWFDRWKDDAATPLYPVLNLFRDPMHGGMCMVELDQHTYR
ncbi:AMP-binding protein [Burkholderia pseudomallei]|uniref:AMP-binding protein n=2 Tax=Burkholderia pseudomallei TaxID=28450 RepID=UPI001FAEDEF6|nr:AMP-binding protein [Burkholderia pseudomallei]